MMFRAILVATSVMFVGPVASAQTDAFTPETDDEVLSLINHLIIKNHPYSFTNTNIRDSISVKFPDMENGFNLHFF